MKVVKNIDYDAVRITQVNGWYPIYDWNFIKKIMNFINLSILILTFLLAKIFDYQIKGYIQLTYESVTKATSSAPWYSGLVIVGFVLMIFLFIITPIHELLHLLPCKMNVFSNKCCLIFQNGSVSAHFDGKITKNKELAMLVTPLITLSIAMTAILFLIPKGVVFLIICLLYISILGCYSDILMFFYILVKLPHNSIIYGNRYKINKK